VVLIFLDLSKTCYQLMDYKTGAKDYSSCDL